jgi:hypothetical protein
VRQLYEAFLKQLDSSSKAPALLYSKSKPDSHPHTDLSFGDAQLRLKVQFIWSPLVNKHMTDSFNDWKVQIFKVTSFLFLTSFYVYVEQN